MLKIGDEFMEVIKNIISVNFNHTTVSTAWEDITSLSEIEKFGNKLSISGNKIIIGDGVGYILVSGGTYINDGPDKSFGFSITHNGSRKFAVWQSSANGDAALVRTPFLLKVSKNDVIGIMVRSSKNSGAVLQNGVLTVEVIF